MNTASYHQPAGYPGKRLLDVVLIAAIAPLFIPLLVCVGLLVRWRVGSPVLFRHSRAGVDGRPFVLIKFRTMRDDRDAHGMLLPDELRLLPFGAFLRSTSLDELPELLNVLRGEMSLVGPRPLLLEYVQRYSPRQRRRLDARPGVTGLAQVRGRNTLPWLTRLELDAQYVDTISVRTDLKILVETALVVFRRRGIVHPGSSTMPEFHGAHVLDRTTGKQDL